MSIIEKRNVVSYGFEDSTKIARLLFWLPYDFDILFLEKNLFYSYVYPLC
jgi:hypothetical protein